MTMRMSRLLPPYSNLTKSFRCCETRTVRHSVHAETRLIRAVGEGERGSDKGSSVNPGWAHGPNASYPQPERGWKGKGIFTTYSTRAPFHAEGGKGNTSKLVKVQMRPDPISK